MDLLGMAAQMLLKKLGSSANIDAVKPALSQLLGDGDGGLDISGLISKMNGGGLASMAASWLGDGDNDAISPGQIMSMFGADKIGAFASSIGTSKDEAASGLSSMLPDLINQNSKGGSLLSAVGGVGGLMGMAKKLF